MAWPDLKAAVVGVGFVGVAHVENLRRLGVEVVGVAGSTPARARAKAAAANLPSVYESYEAMLADPAVDVVHVTTPNHLHAEQVRLALDAGKHVVCEKPLAVDSSESADLLARATASGLVHAVCFNLRYYANNHEARALVARGEIGTPRFVTGGYLQDWLLLDTDWNWRLEPERGGVLRAVADIGSHWVDLVQFVTALRIEAVCADLHTFVPVRRRPLGEVETFAAAARADEPERVGVVVNSDDAAGVLLRFEAGARGVCAISQVSAGRRNALSWEVDGSKAAIAWTSEQPDSLWIGHRERPNELLPRDPALHAPEAAAVSAYPAGHLEGYPDTFRALFAQVYAAIDAGERPAEPAFPTFADGHDALLVTEAIARSSAEQRWVSVGR
jgi:predicted dehydrogenase